tara:strand:- start:2312 stop:3301 length:990 start_codon:yes stop_codon:yes gene_type:complete
MNLNNIDFFACTFDKSSSDAKKNEDFYTERKFLGGWTVSDRHPKIGYKRHTASCVLPSNQVSTATPQDLKNMLEASIKHYATNNNVIFLSGGKDSTALAHAFKKLDIPFTAVSLYSDIAPTSEKSVVEQIGIELGISVTYYKLDTIPEVNFKYWVENPYTAKRIALEELGLTDYNIFTGEIGTGEMQINQSLQYTAMMGYQPQALSYWHVNVCGSYRRNNSIVSLNDNPIYKQCVEHFQSRFAQWDKHPDILNRVMFSRLQDEGAYRLFNYGLDNYKWIHPFAENDFIQACTNMPSDYKGKKNLYKLMYTDLTDIPWRYPKSGLGIPTV